MLGPRAVEQARKFSEQLPETLDQLEDLPLVGGWLARQRGRPTRSRSGCAELPEQFTDERVAELASALVSGIASVAIVAVLAIAVLVDGENLLARFRRLLPPNAPRARPTPSAASLYRTLGRYFGGSITVAVLMGLYVLALGLLLGIPLAPAGRAVGDAHRPHPAGRRVPRRVVPRAAGRRPRA